MRWLRDRVLGAVNHGVENLVWLGAVAVAVLVWSVLGERVTVAAWVLAVAVGAPVALAGAVVLGAAPRSAAGDALAGRYYARHLADALQTLQKVLGGTIPGVTVERFVEDGLLAPARDFLTRRADEEVRLSVLVPADGEWRMAFAAGYRLEAKQRFTLPIPGSFSRYAFESGQITWSHDLRSDPRFAEHPYATHPYRSIVSIPLRSGDDVVGVLNVDSSRRDAFPPEDLTYLRILAAIVEVSWALAYED